MDPFRELGRALLILGAVSAIVGAVFYFGVRLPFRLGRLPGDIIHRGEQTTFYFPIVTCLVVSVVLSILSWLFSSFRR
jgi:membrane associated rhomboid family serine protease